jgi:hypothetical protein
VVLRHRLEGLDELRMRGLAWRGERDLESLQAVRLSEPGYPDVRRLEQLPEKGVGCIFQTPGVEP